MRVASRRACRALYSGAVLLGLALLLVPGIGRAIDGMVLVTTARWFNLGDLVVLDAASGTPRVLIDSYDVFGPTFAPDGARVAFWRAGKIWTLSTDGSDLQEVCDTFTQEFKRQTLSWALDGHIYWSEETRHLYRVDALGGEREIVWSGNRQVQLAKVSLDGTHAAGSSPAWSVIAIDLATGTERNFGAGCQGTISADGHLVTHNLDHKLASIHRFEDGEVVAQLTVPSESSNVTGHRFSHISNEHIVFTDLGEMAYVVEVETDTQHYIGAGQAWDFHPASGTQPHLALRPRQIQLEMYASGLAPGPVTMAVRGLGDLPLVEAMLRFPATATWLHLQHAGTGNAQQLLFTMDPAPLAVGEHLALLSVAALGVANSPVAGTVALDVLELPIPLRINLGDETGGVSGWLAGDLFASGTTLWINSETVDLSDVEHTAPAEVYRSAWGEGVLALVLAVDDGPHVLRLHLASPSSEASLSVEVESGVRITELDVAVAAGGINRALVREWVVDVAGGDGLLLRAESIGGPTLSGLEILERDAVNLAPIVDAGADLAAVEGTPLQLQGSASDDGYTTGVLEVSWQDLAEPDSTFFVDPSQLDTHVVFSTVGEHTLRLTASDGEHEVFDDVLIAVESAPDPAVELLSPLGGEQWTVGSLQRIRWQAQDLSDVTLRYSVDLGASWITLAVSIDDTQDVWGDWIWQVPDTPSERCLLTVEGYFGEASATSGQFTIALPLEDAGSPDIDDLYPPPRRPKGCGCAADAGAERAATWVLLFALIGLLRQTRL